MALDLKDADAQRSSLRTGLEQFREHLGGELTLAMPDSLGQRRDISEFDQKACERAMGKLKRWRIANVSVATRVADTIGLLLPQVPQVERCAAIHPPCYGNRLVLEPSLLDGPAAGGEALGAACCRTATPRESMPWAKRTNMTLPMPTARCKDACRAGWTPPTRRRDQCALERVAMATVRPGEAKLFVAFHILLIDPNNQAARDAFAEAKIAPPLDITGKATGTFTLSAAVDTALAEKVSQNEHPAFDNVVKAIDIHSDLVSSTTGKCNDNA